VAKRVYFCFHYQDVIDFRANVVRNHWVTKDREAAGFFDASLWEEAAKKDKSALKRLINSGLENTTATCVLIGSSTYARPWVRYEIFKSLKRGNKVFGVHINGIPDKRGQTKDLGPNPFLSLGVTYDSRGSSLTMWQLNGGKWLEYTEVDGTSLIKTNGIGQAMWNKGFNLAHFYILYLWNRDNGYENFATWVG
jgi:hypothetical protein